jgi:two-component system phosphate regulon sensor histidine kinase PhoR
LAATNLDRSPPRRAGFTANLVESRWVLAALAVAVAGLAFAGLIHPLAGLAVLGVAAVALAALPRSRTGSDATPLDDGVARPGGGEVLVRLVEILPDPSLILDGRGVVRALNRRAAAELPLAIGDSVRFRLRVPDVLAAFDRVAKGGAPERIEFVERVPTERWFAAWLARLELAADKAGTLVLLMLDDLTERRQSERVRVDFVANASHELRTPLASLTGFIETLQGSARNDPAAREKFLAIMHDQATRMARLVNDLLSLSRVEMKTHVRPTDEVDLTTTVRHVVDALAPLARELGVVVETVAPEQGVMIVGDRDEVTQVFENLIENATKYGQSGKRVVVTITPATADIGPAVAVRDFGPGIAEEHVPRLTERFYRVDVDVSRRHRGTGLGLAIVKHILARHRADLVVQSRPGAGATFTVRFPAVRPDPDGASIPNAPAGEPAR